MTKMMMDKNTTPIITPKTMGTIFGLLSDSLDDNWRSDGDMVDSVGVELVDWGSDVETGVAAGEGLG